MALSVAIPATVLVAACSATDHGSAAAPVPSAAAPVPSASAPVGARPKTLDLKAVADACKAVTPEMLQSLELTGKPTPGTDANTGAHKCDIPTGTSKYLGSIALDTSGGVGNPAAGDTTPTIGGFRALLGGSGQDDYCEADVDVADGQNLAVSITDLSQPRKLPHDELCRRAKQLAEQAITALEPR